MYKFFSFVLVLAVTFMLTDISAQGRGGVDQLTMSHVSKIVPSQVDQVMDLLYDQTANGNTNGYTSQDFEAAFDPYDNQAADDFTATDNWTIDQVVVTGSYSVAGPADGFNVFFYTNNGGMPGTEVYNAPSQAYTYDAGTGMFTITLASPAELPAGDYWVSVQCRMDFGTAGQWYWNQVDGSYGSVAQWQNPGGGFGTSCATWGSIQGCISAIGTDMYFALYGTVGGGGGGAVIFSDNFDSYTAGQQLACQNPTDWTTWNLNPCDPVTDSYVSSNYAHSGANSFVVVADNDEVHYWGPELPENGKLISIPIFLRAKQDTSILSVSS